MAKEDKGELGDKKARIQAVRDHYRIAVDADRENRAAFSADMKFANVPGEQWFADDKKNRKKRLTLQFNRTRVTVKSVINQMRANPGAIKIRGNEDGDKDTADVLEGLIRNILNTSNWDSIRDNAAEYQVCGGYAAWRIMTDYADDSAFDQDIKIEGLRNPLCLYCDPSAYDQTGADAGWWVYTDKLSKAAFKTRYPKAEPVNFDGIEFDDNEEWTDEETVRIAEHWWKKPVTKNLYLLSDGKTIDDSELKDAKSAGLSIVKTRAIQCHEIWSAIYSGDAELTAPTKWAGKYFPWIRIYGEFLVIDGRVYWFGLTRHMKDPQRAHNHALTAATEVVMTAPVNQNQVWATPKQAEGLTGHWASAVDENLPYQLFNPDPANPGPPQRIPPAAVPVAQMQFSQIMGEEMKADSGMYDASLGAQGNETSGKAITARTEQGQIATFNYRSNMGNGERRMGQILVDLIPKIYDTARSMRILGADDSEKYVKINQPDEQGNVVNDLSRGKYDVVVTIGPSFATKRMEAAETFVGMSQSDPTLMPLAGDLVYKALDVPYADEIAERKRMALPPEIQQQLNKDKPLPPEVQQAMAQIQQKGQEVQQQGMLVQQAAQEAQTEKAGAEKAKSDVQVAQSNLKVQAAELKAQEAELRAHYAELQAKLVAESQAIDKGKVDSEGAEQAATFAVEQIQQAALAIQQQADEFMTRAAQVVAAMTQTPLVVEPSGNKVVRVKRVNGELVGTVTEANGEGTKEVRVKRQGDELVGTLQ